MINEKLFQLNSYVRQLNTIYNFPSNRATTVYTYTNSSVELNGTMFSLSPDGYDTFYLSVGESDSAVSSEQVSYIKFDLDNMDIPSGTIIDGFSLVLYLEMDKANPPGKEINVYRCLKTIKANATWNEYDNFNNLSWSGGGARSPEDIDTTNILGSRLFTGSYSASVEGLGEKIFLLDRKELMKILDGTYDNNGFILSYGLDTSLNDQFVFGAKGNSDPLKRPKMLINYHYLG